MRVCLTCDEPLPGPEAFRISIGGVTYDDIHGTCFVQKDYDDFRDGSQMKWLCRPCAIEHDIFIGELALDVCLAVEGRDLCNHTFEPACSKQSETVLLVEWGSLGFEGKGNAFVVAKKDPDSSCPNCGGRGITGRGKFIRKCRCNYVAGHIHYNCACDAWRLPLYDIQPAEAPS